MKRSIDLGNRYFGLEKFSNLQLVCSEASDYMQQATTTFDLIVVDIFKGFIVPKEASTAVFLELLKQRMAPGGASCCSTWWHAPTLIKDAEELQHKFQDCFGKVEVFKTMAHNRVFIVDCGRANYMKQFSFGAL